MILICPRHGLLGFQLPFRHSRTSGIAASRVRRSATVPRACVLLHSTCMYLPQSTITCYRFDKPLLQDLAAKSSRLYIGFAGNGHSTR